MTTEDIALTSAAPSSSPENMGPSSPGRRTAVSSLVLSLLALVGSVAAMAYIGLTVIPVEAGSGYYFSDTPGAYQVTVVIAAASMILWTLLGIAGIICAIVALVRRARPAAPVLALCVGVLAPLLSIGVLEATMEIASTRL